MSVCLVAGPSSPARRARRTDDSTSWGANLRFSRRSGEGEDGDERGDGLGVSSPGGIVFRYRSKVVSMGIGANRARGRSFTLAIIRRVPTSCLILLSLDWAGELCWSVGDIREEWMVSDRPVALLSVNRFPFRRKRLCNVQSGRVTGTSWNAFVGMQGNLPAASHLQSTNCFCILTTAPGTGGWGQTRRSQALWRVPQHRVASRDRNGGMAGGVERKYLHSANLSSKCPRDSTCLSAVKD